MNNLRKKEQERLQLLQKMIRWKHIAGPNDLHPIQSYDVVFDEIDYKIRQVEEIPTTTSQIGPRIQLEARTEV